MMDGNAIRIMIVDDNAFMRMMLKDIFIEAGYDVLKEFDRGQSAIEAYEALRPDIITMDITMPDMNGVEAVRILMSAHSEARIIMVSALNQVESVLEAMNAGARDFVAKPFRKKRIIAAVERLMSREAPNSTVDDQPIAPGK